MDILSLLDAQHRGFKYRIVTSRPLPAQIQACRHAASNAEARLATAEERVKEAFSAIMEASRALARNKTRLAELERQAAAADRFDIA